MGKPGVMTDEKRRIVAEQFAAGATMRAIAEQIGVSEQTVFGEVKRAGLSRPKLKSRSPWRRTVKGGSP